MDCKHGYPMKFKGLADECPYDQPDGATVTDLELLGLYKIRDRNMMYIVPNMGNKKAIMGRVVNIGNTPMQIDGFMSCLIPGHDEGHCTCFSAAELSARPLKEYEQRTEGPR